MTDQIKQARRAAFEAWHREKFKGKYDNGQPTRDMHNGKYAERYTVKAEQERWEAFNAGLDSLCIELPGDTYGRTDYDQGRDSGIEDCRAANPATILALLQHVRELKADANKFREIVCAVVREIPHRDTSRGNAPGHGHSIAGVWDEDNGALAGTECAWCKTWHSAVDEARSSAD